MLSKVSATPGIDSTCGGSPTCLSKTSCRAVPCGTQSVQSLVVPGRLPVQNLFSELDLHEVHGVGVSENEAVAKFVQRLGFSRGTARRGDAWMAEKGWSAVDWVITRETWERSAG